MAARATMYTSTGHRSHKKKLSRKPKPYLEYDKIFHFLTYKIYIYIYIV